MRLAVVALGLLSGLLGAAVAVGVMVWQPWEGEDTTEPVRIVPRQEAPAPSGPLLTGAEAAGKAEAELRRVQAEAGTTGVSVFCDPEDYNERTDTWIIRCDALRAGGALVSFRLDVDDRTGQVSVLE